MQAVLDTITAWSEANRSFALARVVWTSGSSPRRVGATMVISEDGKISGSVSGGCIEGSVIEAASEVLETGRSCELEFGADNNLVWSVGPACGSTIRVRVEPFPGSSSGSETEELGAELLNGLRLNRKVALISTLDGTTSSHLLFSSPTVEIQTDELDEEPIPVSANLLGLSGAGLKTIKCAIDENRTGLIRIQETDFFVHVMQKKDLLIIVGATDIAIHLVRFARALNFETMVIDPRETFTGKQDFEPAPDRMITAWPQEVIPELQLNERTYAVVLTHNAKIDDPMLHILLESSVPYIGALGSRRTHKRRVERLEETGFRADQTARVHGPVGLDIGSATPGEIALSIMAQIIETRNGTRR